MPKVFLVAVAPCARRAEPLPFGLAAGLGGVGAESRATGGPNRAPVPGASPCLRPSPVPFFSGSCLKVQFCPDRQWPFSQELQSFRGIKGPELAADLVVAAEASELKLVMLRASSLLTPTNADAMLRAVLVEAADFLELELVTLRASSLLGPTGADTLGPTTSTNIG